jgi:uncharacterized protein
MFEWDEAKRQKTLLERKLDFADALHIFLSPHITFKDDRFAYTEERFITIGALSKRMVVLVWTLREQKCRIISLRKANDDEKHTYGHRIGLD